MNKILVISIVHILSFFIFILISYFLNKYFLKKLNVKNGIKNMILGIEIGLIGSIIFFIFSKIYFQNIYLNILKYLIPVYIITTSFQVSLKGYFLEE